jgi:hypothetical protein
MFMTSNEIRYNWLLISRTFYNMSNVTFDRWIAGCYITKQEFYKDVVPLMERMSDSSRKSCKELVQLTLELVNGELE